MVIDEVVDEEITVVVVLMPVDGEVTVTVLVESLYQIRPLERVQKLVARGHINVSRRQSQCSTLCVEHLYDGVISTGFSTTKEC